MVLFQHPIFDMTLLSGKRVLDIGCGRNKLAGAIGVDHMALPGVDKVADLNGRLPFEDEEFDIVYSNQVLEHIPNMTGLIGEIHRLLKPSGLMVAHVPYFRSSWAAVDPTHVRSFTLLSLNYFVKGTEEYEHYRFSDSGFSDLQCYLDWNYPAGPCRLLFTTLARRWPQYFENTVLSFLYPFQTLTFILKK